MSEENSPNHVTREELQAELRALSNRFLLYLGIAVGLINFDIPTPVTIGAIGLMVIKGAWVLTFHH